MKIWFKLIKNIQEKGWLRTMKIILFAPKRLFLANHKIKRWLLKKYVRQHNYSYGKISKLAISLNNGLHPKHEIIKYYQFFIDNIEKDDIVLDAGCGNGFVASKVADKTKRVIGIDINPDNIRQAQKKYKKDNLIFKVGDVTNYKYQQKFDKIILSNVLEHIKERISFLQNLGRLSNIILLRVPMLTRDWLTVYKKQNGWEYKLDKTHFIEYTLGTLKEELKEAGWQIKTYQINWGEFWGVIIRSENSKN